MRPEGYSSPSVINPQRACAQRVINPQRACAQRVTVVILSVINPQRACAQRVTVVSVRQSTGNLEDYGYPGFESDIKL